MAQRKVVRAIVREARQRRRQGTPRKAVRKATRAAIATGIVESGLRNLPGGDADSQGWRQERASLYPNPRNIRASVDRFFSEAAELDSGQSAGELAADVQRPASQYRGRYGEVIRSGAVKPYMRLLKGGAAPSPNGKRSGTRTRTTTRTLPGTDNSQARKMLLAQYLLSDQQHRDGGLLELVAGLDASADVPGEKVTTTRRVKRRGKSQDAPVSSGGLAPATRKPGKLIGTPHTGTHTLGNWQSDNAVDIGVPNGTVVQMPNDGVVEKVAGSYSGGASRFDGYQVTVRLSNGKRVFFTHLSKTHVKAGDRLRSGQAVGRSGSANGVPHLHMGVDRGDPRKIARRK